MNKYPKVTRCKMIKCPHLKTIPGKKACCCSIGGPGNTPTSFKLIISCPLDRPVY